MTHRTRFSKGTDSRSADEIFQSADRKVTLTRAKLWRSMEGTCVTAMIHIGMKLGMYEALAGQSAVLPADLADELGLAVRWVEDWAYSQASAGLLTLDDDGNIQMPPETKAVLCDERTSLLGFTWLLPRLVRGIDEVIEGFRTGEGATLDRLGVEAVFGIDVSSSAWYEEHFASDILTHVDGITDRLDRGGYVVDVGCGGGGAILALAKRFPNSTFVGVDTSMNAVDHAKRQAVESRVDNATFICGSIDNSAEFLPNDVDLVLTLDALHDFQKPRATAKAVYHMLRPNGAWIVKEPKSYGSAKRNIGELQEPTIAYALSVLAGLPSSCQAGGNATGTLGFDEKTFACLASEVGFERTGLISTGSTRSQYFVSYCQAS